MIVSPSKWLARKTWGFMLWIMRRPWIKRFRRRMIERQIRAGAPGWLSIEAHDRWAFRHGQRFLGYCFGMLFGSILLSGCLLLAMRLYEVGALQPPESVTRQLSPNSPPHRAAEAPRL